MANSLAKPYLLAGLMAALLLAGCAAGVSGPQRARLLGHEMGLQYMELHQRYNQLIASLPETQKAWLREHAAPAMDRLKQGIVAWNQAAIEWSQSGEPGRDMDALLDEIERMATTAAQLLQEVADAQS